MDRFNEHCGLNNLLLDYQSAYRKWHLCETSLLKLVNDIYGQWNPSVYAQ